MKRMLHVFAITAALAAALFTSAFRPKTIYYYNDGAWKIFDGIPCNQGSVEDCVKIVSGNLRTIYLSPHFGDPLRFDP